MLRGNLNRDNFKGLGEKDGAKKMLMKMGLQLTLTFLYTQFFKISTMYVNWYHNHNYHIR